MTSSGVTLVLMSESCRVGWGEAASAPTMTGETVESMMAAIRYLEPYVKAGALGDIDATLSRMDRALYGNHAAKSAIEIERSRLKAAADIGLAREKAAADMQIEREKAANQMEIERMKAEASMALQAARSLRPASQPAS